MRNHGMKPGNGPGEYGGRPQLVLYVVFVFCLTLPPFEFSGEWLSRFVAGSPLTVLRRLFYLGWKDLIQNILLFVPWGVFSYRFFRARRSAGAWWAVPVLTGLCLSTFIEALQLFMIRNAAVTDILMNVLGTVIGFRYAAGARALRRTRAFLGRVWVRRAAVPVYALAFLGFWILPSRLNRLDRWDPAYPLLVGNEATLDRPWEGTVHLLAVYDRALGREEIARLRGAGGDADAVRSACGAVVLYDFDGRDGETVPDRLSPDDTASLFGHGPAPAPEGGGRRISRDRYYRSDGAGTRINARLKPGTEFSVEVSFRPASLDASGPARIVTVSPGPEYRNFTLGQEGGGLQFRVRNRFAGRNGSYICLNAYRVLRTGSTVHAVATFHRGLERLYIDGKPAGEIVRADLSYLPRLIGKGRNPLSQLCAVYVSVAPLCLLALLFPFRKRRFLLLLPNVLVAGVQVYFSLTLGQPFGLRAQAFALAASAAVTLLCTLSWKRAGGFGTSRQGAG